MDKKKVREAIELLQRQICKLEEQKEYDEYGQPLYNETLDMAVEQYGTAIEALEKQLPKKVDVRTEFKDLNGYLICYKGFCPSCGWTVDSSKNKSCNRCTQLLDWSE